MSRKVLSWFVDWVYIAAMLIGALQKTSLIDYPGRISAIVFTQGCQFRCPFCHNPELVDSRLFSPALLQENVLAFLERRRGQLDAVVVTGGEPTLQPGLDDFLGRVRGMGFLIKLDTNGMQTQALERIITQGLVDYLAMDVKAPLEKYSAATGVPVDTRCIQASIRTILSSGVPHEFRTTVARGLLGIEDILAIGQLIKGARLFALQRFRPSKHVDPDYAHAGPPEDEMLAELQKQLGQFVKECIIR